MTSIPMTGVRPAESTSVRTASKAWAWLGIAAFALGLLVTWAVQLPLSNDTLNAGGQAIISELDTTQNQVIWRVSSGVGFIVIACLIAFAVGLRRELEARSGGNSALPGVVLGSFLVTGGVLAVAMSFRAQVMDGLSAYAADPSSHVTINRLSQDTVLTAWATLGAASAAFAVAGFRGYLVSRRMAWFSAVITGLIVVLCLVGGAFPAHIPAMLWLVVVSIWSLRQPSREEAEATDR